jgi:hypothetical protein
MLTSRSRDAVLDKDGASPVPYAQPVQSTSLGGGTEMLVSGRMQVPRRCSKWWQTQGLLGREGSQLCGDERSSGLCFVRSALYGYSKEPKSFKVRE